KNVKEARVKKDGVKEVRKRKVPEIVMGILALVAAIVVIVVVAILMNGNRRYDDSYFVTDDKKIVLRLSEDIVSFYDDEAEDSEIIPLEAVYYVYYRDGDKINDMKMFIKYGSEEDAREVAERDIVDMSIIKGKEVNGNYLILQAQPETYKGLTVSALEQAIESLEAAGGVESEKSDNNTNTEEEKSDE
ncbi:MAG: hypothetical protein Q4A79_02725, partial [Candidatus Saccharibacteria bacterium]|nr:hypothetical protein [Candidatus Saccharibacteria bacterium]